MRLDYKPKLEKIVEILLYLAHKRPNADHYQAIKLLYLADKMHLNSYGRPITFETYYALPYGPIGTHALNMIKGQKAALKQARIKKLPIVLVSVREGFERYQALPTSGVANLSSALRKSSRLGQPIYEKVN